jgi:hypothetical protein
LVRREGRQWLNIPDLALLECHTAASVVQLTDTDRSGRLRCQPSVLTLKKEACSHVYRPPAVADRYISFKGIDYDGNVARCWPTWTVAGPAAMRRLLG